MSNTTSTGVRAKVPEVPSLTGIRGIAAIWVVLHHVSENYPEVIPSNPLSDAGYRGVDLFFILSGFILMYVHEQDFRVNTKSGMRSFYWARFFRVYPLHVVILLGILAIVTLLPDFVTWTRMGAHTMIARSDKFSFLGFFETLTLTQRWLVPELGEWNGPTWTLSAEVLAYLAFPFLAFRISKINGGRKCLALAYGSLLCLSFVLFKSHSLYANATGRLGLSRLIFGFVCGIALARFRIVYPNDLKSAAWLAWFASALVVICIVLPPLQPLMIFAFASLILSLAYRTGRIDAFLGSKFVVFLGKISFALYLVHFTLLKLLEWGLDRHPVPAAEQVLFILLTVAGCFFAAVLLHYKVEVPIHRWGRLWLRRSTVSANSVQPPTALRAETL